MNYSEFKTPDVPITVTPSEAAFLMRVKKALVHADSMFSTSNLNDRVVTLSDLIALGLVTDEQARTIL